MDFHNRHAIITGGSSGIGRAVARLLTQRGAHVSIIARRQELLDETLAELERRRENKAQWLSAYSADLADWEQARQAVTTSLCRDPIILFRLTFRQEPGAHSRAASTLRAYPALNQLDTAGDQIQQRGLALPALQFVPGTKATSFAMDDARFRLCHRRRILAQI